MRHATFASAMLLVSAAPAIAQNLDALTNAMSHASEAVLMEPDPVSFSFVDISALVALAELDGKPLDAEVLMRTQAGYALRPLEALHSGGPAAWEAKSGLPLAQIESVSGYGRVPDSVAIWALADEPTAAGLLAALAEDGFAPVGEGGVLGNGAPRALDLRNRDPSNPWRSSVGAASFVMAHRNAVVQASVPEILPILAEDERSLADNPIVASALAGLEQAAGDGWIVQAMVISPVFGAGAMDPAMVMSPGGGSVEEMREKIEASLDASAKGIPFYLGGIIADVQLDVPGVSMALVYPDCDTASRAADAIGARWVETMPESAQGEMTITSGEGIEGLCSALVTVLGTNVAQTANPLFNALFQMYVQQQFTVLQIGETD